jgi:5-methylcytosine-specific restriction endonuclease McrA
VITWVDQYGTARPVPSSLQKRLQPDQVQLHAALRAFVFWRDGYQCLDCGDIATAVPAPADHFARVLTARSYLVLDHKVATRDGGSNHPDNLQTLCNRCNARKGSATTDFTAFRGIAPTGRDIAAMWF